MAREWTNKNSKEAKKINQQNQWKGKFGVGWTFRAGMDVGSQRATDGWEHGMGFGFVHLERADGSQRQNSSRTHEPSQNWQKANKN